MVHARIPAFQRRIIVSNRLPVVLTRTAQGQRQATAGAGGVVRDNGGVWVGWSGAVEADAAALEATVSVQAPPESCPGSTNASDLTPSR